MSDDDHDNERPTPIPRPGEAGWSSTGWPDSAGQAPQNRAAPPTPPEWTAPSGPQWTAPWGPESTLPDQPAVPRPPTPPSGDANIGRFGLPIPRPSHSTSVQRPSDHRPPIEPQAPAPQQDSPSQWPPPDAAPPSGRWGEGRLRDRLESVADRVTGAARVERPDESFSLRHMFENSLKRRPPADVEAELMVGTRITTPPLSTVRAEWPQPWLFARTLLASGAVFALFFIGWSVFHTITLLPGLIIVGSFAMPIAVLIFFFEMNLPRNVSLVAVLRMVFFGGTASLLFSLVGFELFDLRWLGAMVAGLIEEPAKLLAVVLVARQARHRFILNGLLFGAAIGAGFAAFESAGYALVAALFAMDNGDVVDNIVLRGLLSPFGHVVWTAITAGALWRVKGSQPLRFEHLKDPRFWRIMVLAILLHTTWNSPIPGLLYVKFLLLGSVAWLVCFSLLQEGIAEVRSEQRGLIV